MALLRVRDDAASPGGRYISDGPFSGEWYREVVLTPQLKRAISSGDTLTVELDGTSGYGSSFLEEAFGGLVRLGKFSREQIDRHLVVVARSRLYEPYQRLVATYIARARREPVAA